MGPASTSAIGLHSRAGLKDRLSTFFLGASDLTLFVLYQLVVYESALIVSEIFGARRREPRKTSARRQTLITFRPLSIADELTVN